MSLQLPLGGVIVVGLGFLGLAELEGLLPLLNASAHNSMAKVLQAA